MREEKKIFKEMLIFEIQDLKLDINAMIGTYQKRHDKEELSNYVFLENKAVMEDELFCLDMVIESVTMFQETSAATLEEMLVQINDLLHTRLAGHKTATGTNVLVKRKIDKILGYLNSTKK